MLLGRHSRIASQPGTAGGDLDERLRGAAERFVFAMNRSLARGRANAFDKVHFQNAPIRLRMAQNRRSIPPHRLFRPARPHEELLPSWHISGPKRRGMVKGTSRQVHGSEG